jgi:hypothetical protein
LRLLSEEERQTLLNGDPELAERQAADFAETVASPLKSVIRG